MDKETKALIDFYDNRIKELEKQNKEKQDKLDKIEELCDTAIKNCYTYVSLKHSGVLMNAHEVKKIIKGEDK